MKITRKPRQFWLCCIFAGAFRMILGRSGDVNFPNASQRQYWPYIYKRRKGRFTLSLSIYIILETYVREGFHGGWDGSDFIPISP